MNSIKVFFQKAVSPIAKSDIFIFFGLLLLGSGLWEYEPWISLTTCGVILIAFGLMESATGGR